MFRLSKAWFTSTLLATGGHFPALAHMTFPWIFGAQTELAWAL
jgi:hypothetical protein